MRSAFTPMELFLVALAGCTAMDVIWTLERQRQKINKLELFARGVRREEDPRYYETIELEFGLEGENLQKNALERAIRLSQEKYCSVKAMIKDSVKVNVTFSISGGEDSEQRHADAAAPRA
jgi:putative redox protein